MKKHLLTSEGLEKLKEELHDLVQVQRSNVIQEIQAAREQGDLSENADYEAAKAQQTIVESRIRELHEILKHYELIGHDNSNRIVKIGSKITVEGLTKKLMRAYEIVGSFDTNPAEGKISNESPLARAVLNRKIGDVVEVKGVAQPFKVKIIAVE